MEKDKIIRSIENSRGRDITRTDTSKISNPGATRQGNFINYYQFNPPSERLSLLFPNNLVSKLGIFQDECTLTCLDIGCNSGVSTTLLHSDSITSLKLIYTYIAQ